METASSNRIVLDVGLDESRVPVSIEWEASDSKTDGPQPAEALLLTLWDPARKQSLCIDLWTKSMPVDEMDAFVFERLVVLAQTYGRATGREDLADGLRMFAEDFRKAARAGQDDAES